MKKSSLKQSIPAGGQQKNTGKNRFDEPLDEQERDIRDAVENDELKPVPDEEASKERLVKAARAAAAKNRHISIRLSERDLVLLRAKALELGMPYQTLIGSILHQYVEGKIQASF